MDPVYEQRLTTAGLVPSQVEEFATLLCGELGWVAELSRPDEHGFPVVEVGINDKMSKYGGAFLSTQLRILLKGLPSPVPVYDTEEE